MILYQMAKRMEQRQQLKQTIQKSEGNMEHLVSQKEQVEEQLFSQANRWTEEGNDEFMLAAMKPEAAEWSQAESTWL